MRLSGFAARTQNRGALHFGSGALRPERSIMGNSFGLNSRGLGWRSTFIRPGRDFDFDDFGRFGRFGFGGFGFNELGFRGRGFNRFGFGIFNNLGLGGFGCFDCGFSFGFGIGFGPTWPAWGWNWMGPSMWSWDPFWFNPWYQPSWEPYSYSYPYDGTDSSNGYDLSYANPSDQPYSSSNPSQVEGTPVENASPVLDLYLTDGTMIPVTDYWLAGNMLHYLLPNGTEVAISLAQIDLQRTVDENARRGIEFILRPGPASSNISPEAPILSGSNRPIE